MLSGTQTTDGFRQTGFDAFSTLNRQASEIGGSGGGDEDQDEGDHRKAEAGEGCGDQHLVDRNGFEMKDVEGYVLQNLDPLQDSQGEEEGDHRKSREDSQRAIEGAVKFLAGAAM